MEDQVTVADHLVERAAGQVDRRELELIPTHQMPEVAELLAASIVVVEAVDPDDLEPVVK
jgi:hypothetical protein